MNYSDGWQQHPVALLAHNRPHHFAQTLAALRACQVKHLYIFVDGPKSSDDTAHINNVLGIIKKIDWTTPHVIAQSKNIGLANSIIGAVDSILADHDTIILLEDDIVVSEFFFPFIHECLMRYEKSSRVLSVSGYTIPLPQQIIERYPWDVYFVPRITSWGWATWRDRWGLYERDVARGLEKAVSQGTNLTRGGVDVPSLIKRRADGMLDAWTPGWLLASDLNGMYNANPTKSLVTNIGMDGTGANCGKSTLFDSPLANTAPQRFPDDLTLDDTMVQLFADFYNPVAQKLRHERR